MYGPFQPSYEADFSRGKEHRSLKDLCCKHLEDEKHTKGFPFFSFPNLWDSKESLLHRQTIILFNEFHAQNDRLGFKSWISPKQTNIWDVAADWNLYEDDEATAVNFMLRFSSHVWRGVVLEWQNVIDQCSEHIRPSVSVTLTISSNPFPGLTRHQEISALEKGLSIGHLERLAQQTWEDSLTWFTLQKLLSAHQKTILKTQHDLKALATLAGITNINIELLQSAVNELKDLERIVSEDFTRRGQSISSLVE